MALTSLYYAEKSFMVKSQLYEIASKSSFFSPIPQKWANNLKFFFDNEHNEKE